MHSVVNVWNWSTLKSKFRCLVKISSLFLYGWREGGRFAREIPQLRKHGTCPSRDPEFGQRKTRTNIVPQCRSAAKVHYRIQLRKPKTVPSIHRPIVRPPRSVLALLASSQLASAGQIKSQCLENGPARCVFTLEPPEFLFRGRLSATNDFLHFYACSCISWRLVVYRVITLFGNSLSKLISIYFDTSLQEY